LDQENLNRVKPDTKIKEVMTMLDDNLDEPLIQKESKLSRFTRYVKGATKAGKTGKEMFSKAKNYSVATQSKGERAFATLAKGADYLDKACNFFPPGKIFTAPIAMVSGKINTLLELRALFKLIKTTEVTPLTLESDLINLRAWLVEELNGINVDSESYSDPEKNGIIVGLDGLIAFIQQEHE
jgi:hypothetical protein